MLTLPPFLIDTARYEESIDGWVRQVLCIYGLGEWSFGWDRAVRRLGICYPTKKRIALSRPFVARYLDRPDEIRDTILHEIAHALAWVRYGRRQAHGCVWKAICREIGARPQATVHLTPAKEVPYKYALRDKADGAIYGGYYRRPRLAKRLASIFIKGHPETKGRLEVVPWQQEFSITSLKG